MTTTMMSRRRSPYRVYGDGKTSPREFRLNANDAAFYVVDKDDWPTFPKRLSQNIIQLRELP